MIFKENQRILPSSMGRMHLIENMRRMEDGSYETVDMPRGGYSLRDGYEAVAADRRDGMINIIGFNGSNLALEGKITSDGDYLAEQTDVCTLPCPPKRWGGAGEFLVLLLTDNSLWFLIWDANNHCYDSLGMLPQLPELKISVEGATITQAAVPAFTFKEKVADMRSGVPSEVKTLVGKAVREIWDETTENLRRAGRWVQPVMGRIGFRLCDGTLYSLSEAIEIAGMPGYAGTGRITIPLEGSGAGATGTREAIVEIPSYSLKVECSDFIDETWRRLFEYVEVYITEEQQPLLPGAAKVVYQSTGHTLGVTFNLADTSALKSQMGSGRVMLSGLMLCSDINPEQVISNQYSRSEPEVLEAVMPPEGKASHICCHDGFLHIACGNDLVTMRRGNPLVEAWRSNFGRPFTHIMAQGVGGGAYTRQYIYVCNDGGTMALLHDSTGKHCNCRQVTDMSVAEANAPQCSVMAEQGVWMLTREGCLALFHDAHANVVLRGLNPGHTLAYNRQYDELMIMDIEAKEALVISSPQKGGDVRGYMLTGVATGNPVKFLTRSGEVIALGEWNELLLFFGEATTSAVYPHIIWETGWLPMPGCRIALLEADARASALQGFVVEVEMTEPRSGDVSKLVSTYIEGPVKATRAMALRLPTLRYPDSKIKIRVKGYLNTIINANVKEIRRL